MPTIPQPQRFFGNAQANIRPGVGQQRWPQQARGGASGSHMMNMQNQFRGPRPSGPRMSQTMVRPMTGQTMVPIMAARPGLPPQAMAQMQPTAVAVAGAALPGQRGSAGYKYGPNVRNPAQVVPVPQAMMTQQIPQSAVLIHGQEPLTASMLAAAPPQEQKQMLGERLFPLIQSMHPELAGKITGMLLEIDNSELVHMLEHQESLKGKVKNEFNIQSGPSTLKVPRNRRYI